VLVVLDCNHRRAHVRNELEACAPFVTPGPYIVAADGITANRTDAPRGSWSWGDDNPAKRRGISPPRTPNSSSSSRRGALANRRFPTP